MPVLKTKQAIVGLKPGDLLRVLATDPGSVADMAAFSRRTGHALVEQGQEDGVYFYVFRKA
jgi:tRNA 2-thiouridine synthesizing protein A